MVEIIGWLLVIGFVFFLFLLFRFIQPQLLYSLRQAFAKVEIQRAFLEADAGIGGAEIRFHRALVKDSRSESVWHDDAYISRRLKKIAELYRLLDNVRMEGLTDEERNPQVCIVELANLLANIGHNLDAVPDYNYPLVHSSELLFFLKTRVSGSKPQFDSDKEAEAEIWFKENPISIEQCIEVLTAIISVLVLRRTITREGN